MPRSKSLCLFLVLCGALLCRAEVPTPPSRVAIQVESPSRSADWQSVLTAALSQQPGLRLVERVELAHLLRESERSVGPSGLASLVGNVQFYLNFRHTTADQWLVVLVDAASGLQLESTVVKGARLSDASALAAAAAALLAKGEASAALSRGASVALLEGSSPNDQTFLLAARLREMLKAAGCRVLDRAFTQPLTVERSVAEKGLREGDPASLFLGADYLVELVPLEGGEGELRVTVTGDGRELGRKRFSLSDSSATENLPPWLVSLFGPQTPVDRSFSPAIEIEALEPFYRGLALYRAAKYLEAASEFTQAYMRNDKFRDAMLWEARCYEALGMMPLAEAVRRYAAVALVGRGYSGSAQVDRDEAIAFLGVSGEPALRASALSAMAASQLTRLPGRKVLMPDSLGKLRREYDWLAGQSAALGSRWDQAPSFFCRLVLEGRLEQEGKRQWLQWTLSDSVSGGRVAGERQAIDSDPARWPRQIEKALTALESAESQPAAQAAEPPVIREMPLSAIQSGLASHRGVEANYYLLRLARENPGDVLLGPRGFEKGQNDTRGLNRIMNYALRDWLIAQLPSDSPRRRWMEFMRICDNADFYPLGKAATGQALDVRKALEKFVTENPTDPAGLVARYALLFESQAFLPGEVLAQRSDALLADLAKVSDGAVPDRVWLVDMTASMRDLALIASGRSEREFPQPDFLKLPRRILAKWKEDGTVKLDKRSRWVTNEYALVPLSPPEKVVEAKAALAINGRSGDGQKVQDQWLKDLPHSMVLAAYVTDCLGHLEGPLGVPLAHSLDWPAERASYLSQIKYVEATLGFWLDRVNDSNSLNRFERTISLFLMALQERPYLPVLSDADFDRLRDGLAAQLDEANRRLGRKRRGVALWIPWRTATRSEVRELTADHLSATGSEIYSREAVEAEIFRAEREAFGNGVCNPKPWWDYLRSARADAAFTARELAQFHLRHLQDIAAWMENRDLSPRERICVFGEGLALFYGGYDRDAEAFFQKILDSPLHDSSRASPDRLWPANAAFRLTQILRRAGRVPEAITMAERGLELCGSNSWRVVQYTYDFPLGPEVVGGEEQGFLASHLTRILREMRLDPALASLPREVGLVTVATDNIDNPQLKVFYRAPRGDFAGSGPHRVLLMAPSKNHDVLEFLEPDGLWARFADAHHLVLVCPQFYLSTSIDRAQHAFSSYLNAQAWSGPALLAALDQINAQVPLEKKKMLVYSYGAGAGFASRLARWQPGLVAAVAAHGGGDNLPWYLEIPGLHPLSDLKGVPFFVSSGEDDDRAQTQQNRQAVAAAFVTVLRGAGVPVEWKTYPGVGHIPTQEIQEASQAFLQKY